MLFYIFNTAILLVGVLITLSAFRMGRKFIRNQKKKSEIEEAHERLRKHRIDLLVILSTLPFPLPISLATFLLG